MSLDLIAASATFPGLATTGTQTFAGAKTFTGFIFNALGALGTPTYSFTGDTDTGMWSSAGGFVNFSTDGVLGLTLSAGATSPVLRVGKQTNTPFSNAACLTLATGTGNSGRLATFCYDNTNPPLHISVGQGTGIPSIMWGALEQTSVNNTQIYALASTTTAKISSDASVARAFTLQVAPAGTINTQITWADALVVSSAGACKFGQTSTSNATTRHEINGCLAVASPSSNNSESGLFYLSSNVYTGGNGMGNRYASTCNGGGIFFDTHISATVECIVFIGNASGDSTTTLATTLGIVKPNAQWILGTDASGFPGNQIYGALDGVAQAAGFVGEVLSVQATVGAGSTGLYVNVCSQLLTKGIWAVSLVQTMSGTVTGTRWIAGISDNSTANSFTDISLQGGNAVESINMPTAVSNVSLSIANYIINLSSDTTYYMKGLVTYSSGTPSLLGRFNAIRIA